MPRRALGVFLELEAWAVAVARRQHKAARRFLRDAEGDAGRAAARQKILPAMDKAPPCVFRKLRVARRKQAAPHVCDHVICAGTFFDELQKLFCKGLFHTAPPKILFSSSYHARDPLAIHFPGTFQTRENVV